MTKKSPPAAEMRTQSVKRGAGGKFLPGHAPKSPGRPSLPEEFTARGPSRLQKMEAIADDEAHQRQFDALKWCLERQYGKARESAQEGSADRLSVLIAALMESPNADV